MTATTRPATANTPAATATDLAHDLLESGWKLSGAHVRVIHTAILAGPGGMTAAVVSDAGKVRLEFGSAPCSVSGAYRPAWHATANGALPLTLLAAVSAANDVATNRDEATVGDLLTAAGWQPIGHDRWAAPHFTAELFRIPEALTDEGPLRWRIRRRDLSSEIHASDDTPPSVIVAFALTGLSDR